MSDSLTVLTSSTTQLTKAFSSEDLKELPFSQGKMFSANTHPVHDLESLSGVLKDLEADPSKTVIRGQLRDCDSVSVRRAKGYFEPTSRQWCMIDIDSLEWEGDAQDQKAMVSHAVSKLPSEFHGVDCWYHFSSSMGIKSGIRVHLWYWLERTCSDDEMKAWLAGCPVDQRMYDPVQIHLTANPQFIAGAVDPYPNRSGLFDGGSGKEVVPVPDDLASRAVTQKKLSTPRTRSTIGMLDPDAVVRDPETGKAIDGREQLMFLLSNEVMTSLVTGTNTPTEDEVTEALWARFSEEADLTVVSKRGPWTIEDARTKVRARLRELEDGTYSFVARDDRVTLVAGSEVDRPKLVSGPEAQEKLNSILADFFQVLSEGGSPRVGVRLTMGTGKTKKTIEHLKDYLTTAKGQSIEVYVPRHDLASEWEEDLADTNARIIHVYPRAGGWDKEKKVFKYPIMCERADYVRDLECKGHSIYGNACLSRVSNERCTNFTSCKYLGQFRDDVGHSSESNTVRIYTHASLFLPRNEFERKRTPNLVIIDEGFLPSAAGNLPEIDRSDIIEHIRTANKANLGFDLIKCLSTHGGRLSYLRDMGIEAADFRSVPLAQLLPRTNFDSEATQSRDVGSAKLYRNLELLIDHLVPDLEDEEKDRFEQLVYDKKDDQVIICKHRPTRIDRSVPVLYLDATLDQVVIEPYLPELEYHRIDVRQLAVVSQVHDRSGSNTFWNGKIVQEKLNLGQSDYSANDNDLAGLIVVLNAWADAGETPLLVGHKKLCDFLRDHPKLDERVSIAHFGALRGTNEYKNNSAIFITGRNQPSMEVFDWQARSVFGETGYPVAHEDYDNMPTDQVSYWLSDRGNEKPSAISLQTFSDPRVVAVQKQIREAETAQAIARLRLVWSDYQKRVFLLSNLPVEMPVDHLISFGDLMPDKLQIELLTKGDVPITQRGLQMMRPDLVLSEDAAKKLVQRSHAANPGRMLSILPDLERGLAQVAVFKAGEPRKTEQRHIFLPKNFKVQRPKRVGEGTVAEVICWSDEEVLKHLEKGWGTGKVNDLRVELCYQPTSKVSA
jgi:hypothetical protein